MAKEGKIVGGAKGSLAEQDEVARRRSAQESAQKARQAELDRRDTMRAAQEQAAQRTPPPMVLGE